MTTPVPTVTYAGIDRVFPAISFTPGDNTVRLGTDYYMTEEQLDHFIAALTAARVWSCTGNQPEVRR